MTAAALPLNAVLGARKAAPLTPLREDLRLFKAAPNRDGSPAWLIHDPVNNRFYRIGWAEFELLSRWPMSDRKEILADIAANTPLELDPESIAELENFLFAHQLVRASSAAHAQHLVALARRARTSKLQWLIHNYLFFRIPLIRPQTFLQATLPWVRVVFTPAFAIAVLLMSLMGVGLAARQWDVFLTTLIDSWSWEGILGYAVALCVAKSLHELGHAYTATRYGVRVAHMGIAFIVLWPMLYTDTSESWKLSDRTERFRIAAAGVITELGLAGVATLCWSLAPEGAFKSACFFLAAVSWVLTLAINASPFMRFDGYFLLSDALDVPNLHARAFAVTRAWLRRVLFSWDEPYPDTFSAPMRRFLITFSLFTWAYRLVVFLAIAALVYVFFFKVLGIILFAVEIGWFIVRPIVAELKVWMKRRQETKTVHRIVWLLGGALIVGLLAVPLPTSVSAPAWLHASDHQAVYTPVPARIVSMRSEGPIKAGETIAVLDSPDTRSRAVQAALLVAGQRTRLDQAVGRTDGAQLQRTYAEQLAQQIALLESERAELRRLELRAPFDGRLLDVERTLAPGAWIGVNQPIAVVVGGGPWVVEAFVDQRSVRRIHDAARVWFYPSGDAAARIAGEVLAIDSSRLVALPNAMLAAKNGGSIPTVDAESGLVPRDALYRVRIEVKENPLRTQSVRAGRVNIEGEARSLAAEWLRTAAAAFIRESGF